MNSIEKETLIAANRVAYDTIAAAFSDTRQALWDDLPPLASYCPDGGQVLDVGCGNGRLYQIFDRNQVDYVGVDQSAALIAHARAHYSQNTFYVAEMTQLPLEDAQFDVVYCIATFHHLPDDDTRTQALREMRRVARPGAYIVILDWNLLADWAQAQMQNGRWVATERADHWIVPWRKNGAYVERHYWSITKEQMRAYAKTCDVRVVQQYYTREGKATNRHRGNNTITVFEAL